MDCEVEKILPSEKQSAAKKVNKQAQDKAVITKEQWLSFPAIRWASSHIRELLPTRSISARNTSNQELESALVPLGNMSIQDLSGHTHTLDQLLELMCTDSIVVLHQGKLAYENYWNDNTQHTQHWFASVTKSITGTLAAILLERNILNEQSLVSEYVPELKESAFGAATIRQVLDMAVAMSWSEEPSAFADKLSPVRKWEAALSLMSNEHNCPNTYSFLKNIQPVTVPGNHWQYACPTTDALGWIIERVTGQSFTELISKELWDISGATDEAYCILDPVGKAFSTGGVCASARDLARFGQLFVDAAAGKNRGGITKQLVDNINARGDSTAFSAGVAQDSYCFGSDYLPGGSYRSHWWLYNNSDKAFRAQGIHGQFCYINPTAEIVIARLASREFSYHPEDDHLMTKIFDQIVERLRK